MAQTEDTELRDLVIEALEKNGSLAKIRALLRANIFLAFEDERENINHNTSLSNILNLPEGVISLSIVHEFLEFCNLKNTLFVYMSESRQGKEYKYEGKSSLFDKLNLIKQDLKEPVLITLLKTLSKCHLNDSANDKVKYVGNKNFDSKDEQNCTYIVHDDFQSSTSNSNSDNSSDEKSKLQLRLQLDNSDTDTSSDSARDKSSSEYIPNEFLPPKKIEENIPQYSKDKENIKHKKEIVLNTNQGSNDISKKELRINPSSSDSTSYIEIKSPDTDKKTFNTSGIASNENKPPEITSQFVKLENQNKVEISTNKSPTLSSVSSITDKNVDKEKSSEVKSLRGSGKSDVGSADYSLDFSSSPRKLKESGQYTKSVNSEDLNINQRIVIGEDSTNHSSQSTLSSISISDVADLISDKSFPNYEQKNKIKTNTSFKTSDNLIKIPSDNSGELTESPIPSLSNLSLDIHSD